jgi:protein SCO1/2
MYPRCAKFASFLAIVLTLTGAHLSAQTHFATGMLIKVESSKQLIVVSCDSIPGYMDAMVMSFAIKEMKAVEGLKPGMILDFEVVQHGDTTYADKLHVRSFQNLELDPTQAKRLKGLEDALAPSSNALSVGQMVPDFDLVDQDARRVSLAQFAGKVVAVTFMYTRCPFPNYCVRLSENFARLQRRFSDRIGRDLVLLSVVIDPTHDQPTMLSGYAKMWKADPAGWHFLTGSTEQIQQVCRYFDMNYYPDEGLFIHSFHTIVIDRKGKLAANLEGNEFTARELGDLVDAMLEHPRR